MIGSAGRRSYLVKWFHDAFKLLGVRGSVTVTDANPRAAAFDLADNAIVVPSFNSLGYEAELVAATATIKPHIFFSVNDYEIQRLKGGFLRQMQGHAGRVLALGHPYRDFVSDKMAMSLHLQSFGIATPKTVLASDIEGKHEMLEKYSDFVVKHRYGSGSSGLSIVKSERLESALSKAVHDLPDSENQNPLDLIVIQNQILGEEYGLDVIAPFGNYRTGAWKNKVLARQKLSMGSGETYIGRTVASTQFEDLGHRIALALQHEGLVDVDVMVSQTGEKYVVDINPRFGGGYPFNHMAGANVPLYYVAMLADLPEPQNWENYEVGVVGTKFENVAGPT